VDRATIEDSKSRRSSAFEVRAARLIRPGGGKRLVVGHFSGKR